MTMASIGGCCSSSASLIPRHRSRRRCMPPQPPFVTVPNNTPGQRRLTVMQAAALTARGGSPSPLPQRSKSALLSEEDAEEEKNTTESVKVDKLDDWMTDSISEIVRNIGKAPFLVHLFGEKSGGVTLQREAALPDNWPRIKNRWEKDGGPRPDGIILVEELAADADGGNADAEAKLWGLVVQGRGMDCAACYVLNTCRVRSPAGFCTHFCLARAQCFGDPLELQLRNAWLQRLAR